MDQATPIFITMGRCLTVMFESHSTLSLLSITQEERSFAKHKILAGQNGCVRELCIHIKRDSYHFMDSLVCIPPDQHIILGRLSAKMYTLANWGKSDYDKKVKMQGLPDERVSPFCFPVLIALHTHLKYGIYYPIL